jgi:hypothetical protein
VLFTGTAIANFLLSICGRRVWSVYSDATVKVITKAASEFKADTKIGRAEALRRSMMALITEG